MKESPGLQLVSLLPPGPLPRLDLRLFVRVLLLVSLGISGSAAADGGGPGEPLQRREIISKVHTIDRIYPSMKGPSDTQYFQLGEGSEPELVWLKSTRLDIVDEQGEPMSSEYLCHSNLYFSDYRRHFEIFDRSVTANQRFIDINQGLLELRLPDGFGVPMMSNEPLKFHSMVLNVDAKPEPFDVRVKTTFEYVPDKERKRPIKALAQRSIAVLVPIADPATHALHHDSTHGTAESCSGEPAHSAEGESESQQRGSAANSHKGPSHNPSHNHDHAKKASRTVHWIVPPGRHVYRFRPKPGLRIPYPETTLHVLTGHMHAYGESIELRDVTDGKTLFRADAEPFDDATGIEHMTHYASEEGLPVYQDHQYELIATYDNTTGHDVDAMAVLYFYYFDRKFDRDRKSDRDGHLDGKRGEAMPGRQRGVAVN
jgi:hypothetical protein